MKNRMALLLILIALFILLSPAVFFVVDETQQGVVLQFRKPVRVIVNRATEEEFAEIKEEITGDMGYNVRVSYGPGLYMKLPFLQSFQPFEARQLDYDEDPKDIVTGDKYKLSVDVFARWRVRNPLKFLLNVQNEGRAERRLSDIISSSLRETLGGQSHYEVIRSTTRTIEVSSSLSDTGRAYASRPVSFGREELMRQIAKRCDESIRQYGVEVTDVRVKKVDFLDQNATSVFERMIAERNRIATRYLNEGKREAQIIESETDRQVKVILAEAEKTNLEIKGQADAQAARIYADGFEKTLDAGTKITVEGFNADPEFYGFYRKLQALEKVVRPGGKLVLTSDSPLFDLFNPQEFSISAPEGP